MADSETKAPVDPFAGFITAQFKDGSLVEPQASASEEKPGKEHKGITLPKDTTPDPDRGEEPPARAEEEHEEEHVEEGEEANEPAPEPKRAKTASEKRIDQLTYQLRQAQRETRAIRAQLEGRQPGSQSQSPTREEEPAEGGEDTIDSIAERILRADPNAPKAPDETKFKYGKVDDDYRDAYYDYRDARKAALNQIKEGLLAEQLATAQEQEIEEGYRAKVEEQTARGVELFDDFEEKVIKAAERGDWPLSQTFGRLLLESEVGPEMAYHLASNPNLAKEIFDLSDARQAVRFGRLEDQFLAKRDEKKTAATRPSSAPEPLKGRIRGAGGQFKPSAETEDFSSFEQMGNALLRGK